jgi:putative component of toxin-antitoxin plasmid stabilization module
MVELRKTARFARWLDGLSDVRGRARIQARIERLAAGNPGDVALIILLAGGIKRTQAADIKAALQLARGLSE